MLSSQEEYGLPFGMQLLRVSEICVIVQSTDQNTIGDDRSTLSEDKPVSTNESRNQPLRVKLQVFLPRRRIGLAEHKIKTKLLCNSQRRQGSWVVLNHSQYQISRLNDP